MKQEKLYQKALKKHEAEQKAEEAKRQAEEAKTGKPAAKGKQAAPKKGKDPDKPDIEVEQLPVPGTTPYVSESNNKYVRERPIDEIITKLLTPQEDEESDGPEEDKEELKKDDTQEALSAKQTP